MTDKEIAQVADIANVSEEVVRRVAADEERIKQVKEKRPWCTDQQAVMYIIDHDKFVWE